MQYQPRPQHCYGVFTGQIDSEAVRRIIRNLNLFIAPGAPPGFCIHLLMHSLGGEVPNGVILHNFFKSFPLKLILYNGGNVDSAAVLAFLGARERRASTYATFTVHRSIVTLAGPLHAMDLQQLAENALVEDQRTEAIIRASGIKLTNTQWSDFMN